MSILPSYPALLASQNASVDGTPYSSRSRARIVLIASSDANLRDRLHHALAGLRWHVIEAPGGAAAWEASQASQLEALVIDPWLPDLDVQEFLKDYRHQFPNVDLMMTDGVAAEGSVRSPYHQEILYALRRSQEVDTAAWNTAPMIDENSAVSRLTTFPPLIQSRSAPLSSVVRNSDSISSHRPDTPALSSGPVTSERFQDEAAHDLEEAGQGRMATGWTVNDTSKSSAVRASEVSLLLAETVTHRSTATVERIPELIGTSPVMLEVSRRIRLVAARTTPVLIEGPTGSGKEVVAEALHRLSKRARKPFVAINCAAIPEALLEAELFGHTRGAFTGAVQGRIGRIESADGGTLFLDEIGEMPLALQSKLLRFFESGELQRIGDNETIRVDVRIIAATHQPLAENAQKGSFRADLYYRLAVFLIHTPALAEHMNDLPQFVSHFMERMGRTFPVKRVDPSAMFRLASHCWPGNVRELEHVLERAAILAGDDHVITASEIDFGVSMLN